MFKLRKTKKVKPLTIEERLIALETSIETERLAKQEAEAKLAKANQELSILRETAKEHEEKKNSSEPWVEVTGESIDPVRGIEIRLDWNAAFIQYLKENGITGRDEDTAVQKWLAFLYQDLIETLEQKAIDNSDKKTVSDFL